MNDYRNSWSSVTLDPGAELIAGWRPRRDRLDAAAIELSTEVAAELREPCVTVLEQLARMVRRTYDGRSSYIEPGEEYLAVPATQLPRTVSAGPDQPDEDASSGLSDLERLVAAVGLPLLSPHDLRDGRYLFYAVICTAQSSGQRIGFVRQTNPQRVARTGGLMTLRGHSGLQHLEDPVFVFDGRFDLVVSPAETAVLRLEAFNRMFADLNTLALAAPANASKIAGMVGQVAPAAVEALARAAAERPSLARRLQRLAQAGAVPSVTPRDLSQAMLKHGLDPAQLVTGNEITFPQEQADVFLDLIEQRYYETEALGKEPKQTDQAVAWRNKVAGHAFISYVREDSHRVDQLQQTLQTAGIPVWRDTADLWPGEDWRLKIRNAITNNALVFIACFSQASLARDITYQNEELTLAIEQLRLRRPDDPWLIPVRFDECEIPDRDIGGGRTLASIQRADLFGERSSEGTARLVAAILRILRRQEDDEGL